MNKVEVLNHNRGEQSPSKKLTINNKTMITITITKTKEAEEHTLTRKYDDQTPTNTLQEAVIEMTEILNDTRTIEEIISPSKSE